MPYRVLKESLNAVIDSLSDGILVTDEFGKVILYNQRAEALLGIAGKDALDQPVQDQIKNDVRVGLITKIWTPNMPDRTGEVCLMDTGNIRLRVHVDPVRDKKALLVARRPEEARPLLEPLADSHPSWVEAWKALAGARAMTGDVAGGREAIARAIDAARSAGSETAELEAIARLLGQGGPSVR